LINWRHSVELVPSTRHNDIGTVSLPASSRCVRASEVGYWYWPLYHYCRRREAQHSQAWYRQYPE